jgi:hypothetical protein
VLFGSRDYGTPLVGWGEDGPRLGGGIGYQLVAGEPNTAIPLDRLSSIAFNIQARVGER